MLLTNKLELQLSDSVNSTAISIEIVRQALHVLLHCKSVQLSAGVCPNNIKFHVIQQFITSTNCIFAAFKYFMLVQFCLHSVRFKSFFSTAYVFMLTVVLSVLARWQRSAVSSMYNTMERIFWRAFYGKSNAMQYCCVLAPSIYR